MTRTVVTTTRTTVHDLSMHGRGGAMLILLLAGLAVFVVAFSSAGWRKVSSTLPWEGLWHRCAINGSDESWFVAVQAMMCITLILLVTAVILIFLYMFAPTVSKYQTLLALTIVSFLTVLFLLIGIIIYGAKSESRYYTLHWSYAFAIISCVICLVAAIISAVHISRV